MADDHQPAQFSGRGWPIKFRNAFRGILEGVTDRGNAWMQNSFLVHIPAGLVVVAYAFYRNLDRISISVLIGCIALVWVAELANSAIESLAKAVTDQPNENIRKALDISSGAVLVASLFATLIGLLIFL